IASAATIAAITTLPGTHAVAAIAGAGAAETAAKRPPLVHHVFFWLKNPTSAADRDKLVEGVRTLSKIPTVKELHVGVLANTEKRDVVDTSWAVSELMFFDDVQGQATYQSHPIHLDFIKNYSHLWEKVVVYDAMEA
ncbi:MAG TPA: Dabb family protein, partial [Puia sp.]